MTVKARKLPAGFAYPINRRALKDALRSVSDHVGVVELGGISWSEKPLKQQGAGRESRFWIGNVDVLWVEGSCQFRVRIEGVRKERIETLSAAVERLMVRDITQFVEGTLSLRDTDPAWGRARSCHLVFHLGADGDVESRSFVPA
ncbi:MAG TPA: hypothetical protein VGS07_33620 [Thermoanaerobaculia bacterium]|jgi:hypothetical protein|nr:hypothetical protein [Thermoanaerobaculia bacterium]